jgi:protein involved in polysaccharide export with SLBB domain
MRFVRRFILWAAMGAVTVAPVAAQIGDNSSAPGSAGDVPTFQGTEIPFGPSTYGQGTTDPLLGSAPPALAGPVDPTTYRIGPGDILQLQMWGRVSRNLLLQVGPEGYVLVPGSGSLRVVGETLADVRTELLKRLQGKFRGVSMDLRLGRPRTFRIYLSGQVKTPGATLASGASRVGDILTEAMLLDDASRRRIDVQHTNGTREVADLLLFYRTGNQSLNPYLQDGDVLTVPVATDFMWAQGAVARGGRFELGHQDSLLTLFRLAGDPIPAADIHRALLVRWNDPVTPESVFVRLDEVYSGLTNPAMRDGDRLYVYYMPQYHLQHEAIIVGEVARPGPYPVVEGRHHLSDLVTAAGGFLPTADLSSIRVHRRNPSSTEKDPELERLLRLSRADLTSSEYDKLTTKLASLREDYRVDWNRLSESRGELDLLLRDGDIVRVERLVSSVRIDGEVRRPGILAYQPQLGVGDYVKQAGGFADRAWRSRIRVTRVVSGQTLPAANVRTLDPGDFIWVPERPDRSWWDHSRDLLTAMAQVATVIIAVRSIR